jgi:uncharacterized membrane protein YgcG
LLPKWHCLPVSLSYQVSVICLASTPVSAAEPGTPAVQEAAMYPRILIIVLLGLLTSACAPYYESDGYYRSDYYSSDRYVYPGYYRQDRYYVTPQPRYYYQPAPRYYQPAPRYYRPEPAPHYRPGPPPGRPTQWQGNPRHDYGNRQRYDYGRDRDRQDYRNDNRGNGGDRWHSQGGQGNRDRRPNAGGGNDSGNGRGGDRNWQR